MRAVPKEEFDLLAPTMPRRACKDMILRVFNCIDFERQRRVNWTPMPMTLEANVIGIGSQGGCDRSSAERFAQTMCQQTWQDVAHLKKRIDKMSWHIFDFLKVPAVPPGSDASWRGLCELKSSWRAVIYRTALNISFLKRNIEKGQHVSLHIDLFFLIIT